MENWERQEKEKEQKSKEKRKKGKKRDGIQTAELDRRVQVTAINSWGPTPNPKVGGEVDYQVAAPTEREHPPGTERNIAHKKCEWKDGDRGGLAEWEQTESKEERKSVP
jgi:hypothetical protein